MTLKTSLLIPAAALIGLALPAYAQSVDASIDVDGDGYYSFPELQAAMPDMTEDTFTALDTSGDGLLDIDEVTAGVEAGVLPASDG